MLVCSSKLVAILRISFMAFAHFEHFDCILLLGGLGLREVAAVIENQYEF